ncbi:MAG: DUF4124 domain-containing protein [Gammaproteobacteria bacterium]
MHKFICYGFAWGLLGLCSMAVATEVYQWRDAEGRVHFGDRPPNKTARPMTLRTGPAPATPMESAEARRARTQRLLNEYATERSERVAEREKSAAALDERRRACVDARGHVAELEASGYLYTRDAAGEKQILPEVELRLERERARARVKQVCRGDAIPPQLNTARPTR